MSEHFFRYALEITFRAEQRDGKIRESVRYLKSALGVPLTTALKVDELTVAVGEQPRWFVSSEEAENVRERIRPAIRRALTFWVTSFGGIRRTAIVSIAVVDEHDVKGVLGQK